MEELFPGGKGPGGACNWCLLVRFDCKACVCLQYMVLRYGCDTEGVCNRWSLLDRCMQICLTLWTESFFIERRAFLWINIPFISIHIYPWTCLICLSVCLSVGVFTIALWTGQSNALVCFRDDRVPLEFRLSLRVNMFARALAHDGIKYGRVARTYVRCDWRRLWKKHHSELKNVPPRMIRNLLKSLQ